MRLIGAIFLILITHYSYSQEYDSLLREIELRQDTTQVQALMDLGRKLRRSHPDSAINLFERAERRAMLIGYPKGQMMALNGRGIANGMNNRYPESILCFSEVVELGKKYHYPIQVADAYNGLGIVYKRLGDYPTSYEMYNAALEIYHETNSYKGLASSYENLAVLHDLMDEFEESYNLYIKARDILDSLGLKESVISLNGNIAIYHLNVEEYNKALDLLLENYKHYDSTRVIYRLVNTANNTSYTYRKLEKYDSAIYYASVVINEVNEGASAHELSSAYLNRSYSYAKLGQYDKAFEDARKNQEITNKLGLSSKLDTHELLASIYKASGDYKNALEESNLIIAYKDSLFEDEKVQSYKAEQVKQRVFEKNQQIREQQTQMLDMGEKIQRDKQLQMILIAVAVLLIITVVLLYQKYTFKHKVNELLKKKNEQIQEQKSKIEVINKELENRMLRAQINPHFIFNALNSIQHLITSDDRKSALKYLTKFSALLRQVLENSIEVKVKVADELKFLQIYLELESLRFDDSFDYHIEVEQSVNPELVEMPILLLQPFVENAIIHGLVPKEDNKSLQIFVRDEDNYILFVIEDNGIGREAAAALKKEKKIYDKSRGMSVTEQRIQLLQSKAQKGEVHFEDLKDEAGNVSGTRVIIKLPKEE